MGRMSTLKGISPLIAVVLLVGFAVSVAVIISGWLMPFAREQGEEFEERGDIVGKCPNMVLSIMKAKYNCSSGKLSINAESLGTEPVSEFRFLVTYRNLTYAKFIPSPSNVTLKRGEWTIFHNSSIGKNESFEEVSIYAEPCRAESIDTIKPEKIEFTPDWCPP